MNDANTYRALRRDMHQLYVDVGGDMGASLASVRGSVDQDLAAMRDAGFDPVAQGALLGLMITRDMRHRPDILAWALLSALKGYPDALETLAVALVLEVIGDRA